jgi:hypothetical protein
MKNNQNVRRMTLKLMRVMQSKLQNAMWRIAHRATPAQNVMHAHAQCKSQGNCQKFVEIENPAGGL